MDRSQLLKKIKYLPWRVFSLGFAIGLLLTGFSFTRMHQNQQNALKEFHAEENLTSQESVSFDHHKHNSIPQFNFYHALSDSQSLQQVNKSGDVMPAIKKTNMFYLEVGFFTKYADILLQQNQLKAWHIDTHIFSVNTVKQKGYILKVGPFYHIKQAFVMKRKLLHYHIDTFIVAAVPETV
ncbi:MAG: hypothetical protein HAW62_06600 [Endozoicomonadaceae bacterium]|nr:hypothetical protein [Endozoicomonadaceae bacterium]